MRLRGPHATPAHGRGSGNDSVGLMDTPHPSSRHPLRWTSCLLLLVLALAWSTWATATSSVPAWLGVASIFLSLLFGALSLAGLGPAAETPEDDAFSPAPARRDRPTDSVPAEVAASPTLTALWRRGRESGRDEISLAVDGLREAGSKSVAGMRKALAEGRPEGAATCARSLAGLASMLERGELNRFCRELADELEDSRGIPDDGEERVDAIETALDQAVTALRRLWPPAKRT